MAGEASSPKGRGLRAKLGSRVSTRMSAEDVSFPELASPSSVPPLDPAISRPPSASPTSPLHKQYLSSGSIVSSPLSRAFSKVSSMFSRSRYVRGGSKTPDASRASAPVAAGTAPERRTTFNLPTAGGFVRLPTTSSATVCTSSLPSVLRAFALPEEQSNFAPVGSEVPPALLPVCGVPLVAFALDFLARNGKWTRERNNTGTTNFETDRHTPAEGFSLQTRNAGVESGKRRRAGSPAARAKGRGEAERDTHVGAARNLPESPSVFRASISLQA
ncbi:hypothetical protein BESB_032600 [Besnoitia besnoiti]|uniref:Uncharacterized protein n=1 Tax=Besnoitia besnoiti TaxID=94643 RepID=A0A2A9M5Y2_BESBE|nr:uncharacterized protein BESB_032600 [Besnoitia besnoiti]PFH31063.1 hypothetical protein BESB_032600 [Besnoitia besnoiti]